MLPIKKVQLNPKEKMLAYLVGGVIVIFIFQKFILGGIFYRTKKLGQEIKKSEAELSIAMSVQSRKDSIEEDNKLYGVYIPSEKLSDVAAVTDFLKEVEDIAGKSKVSIINLSPESQAKEAGAYKKFYASMKFEATPEAFFAFLAEVQKSKALVKIEKLTMSAKDEFASALRVDATMSMAVF